jgi:hypothetical protein
MNIRRGHAANSFSRVAEYPARSGLRAPLMPVRISCAPEGGGAVSIMDLIGNCAMQGFSRSRTDHALDSLLDGEHGVNSDL